MCENTVTHPLGPPIIAITLSFVWLTISSFIITQLLKDNEHYLQAAEKKSTFLRLSPSKKEIYAAFNSLILVVYSLLMPTFWFDASKVHLKQCSELCLIQTAISFDWMYNQIFPHQLLYAWLIFYFPQVNNRRLKVINIKEYKQRRENAKMKTWQFSLIVFIL